MACKGRQRLYTDPCAPFGQSADRARETCRPGSSSSICGHHSVSNQRGDAGRVCRADGDEHGATMPAANMSTYCPWWRLKPIAGFWLPALLHLVRTTAHVDPAVSAVWSAPAFQRPAPRYPPQASRACSVRHGSDAGNATSKQRRKPPAGHDERPPTPGRVQHAFTRPALVCLALTRFVLRLFPRPFPEPTRDDGHRRRGVGDAASLNFSLIVLRSVWSHMRAESARCAFWMRLVALALMMSSIPSRSFHVGRFAK